MSSRADRWRCVEAALRAIEPNIDAAAIEAAKAMIDPDRHAAFFRRVEKPYMTLWQIAELRAVIEPAVAALRQISPQAWFRLRTAAYQAGHTLPASPRSEKLPARFENWLFDPPGIVEHLEAILEAADRIGRPSRGARPGLMVERAVAGACCAVHWHLRRRCPTTSHPNQLTSREDPYHGLVRVVFEEWRMGHWENRAHDAAVEWRAVVGS